MCRSSILGISPWYVHDCLLPTPSPCHVLLSLGLCWLNGLIPSSPHPPLPLFFHLTPKLLRMTPSADSSQDDPLLPASYDASMPSLFPMAQSTAPFSESRPYPQSRANSSSSLPEQVTQTPPCSPTQEGIVHMLLARGADVNIQNNRGQTPLHIAAQRGDMSIVRLLLTSKFINVDAQDCWGATPLHLASENGHIEVVKLLVAHNAQLNVRASTA